MISRPTPVPRTRAGFTLIELLTVIAIIGILAAILIPTVGKVRETARRTSDASNIRQIVQSTLIFANQHDGRLPTTVLQIQGTAPAKQTVSLTGGTTTYKLYMQALAIDGGLNDSTVWVSPADNLTDLIPPNLPLVLTSTFQQTEALTADPANTSVDVVGGLTSTMPPSVPVAVTRGLDDAAGVWSADGVYGNAGGHVGFLGGNVSFFDNLGSEDTGRLVNYSDGSRTHLFVETLPPGSQVFGCGVGSSMDSLAPE